MNFTAKVLRKLSSMMWMRLQQYFLNQEGENILPRRSAQFEEEAANKEDEYEDISDEELTDLYRPFT